MFVGLARALHTSDGVESLCELAAMELHDAHEAQSTGTERMMCGTRLLKGRLDLPRRWITDSCVARWASAIRPR